MGSTQTTTAAPSQTNNGGKELRRLTSYDDDSLESILSDVEQTAAKGERLMHYLSSLVVYSIIVVTAGSLYILFWFLYLRGDGIHSLRQDYPLLLHPAHFWILLLDYGLVSYIQATAGMISLDKNTQIVIGSGWALSVWGLLAGSVVLLLVYPILFLLWCGIVLAFMNNEVVYSKALEKYTDRECHVAKARKRYLSWLPIISDLLTWEIRYAVPIGDSRAEGTNLLNQRDRRLIFTESGLATTATCCSVEAEDAVGFPDENADDAEGVPLTEKVDVAFGCGRVPLAAIRKYSVDEGAPRDNYAKRVKQIGDRIRCKGKKIEVELNEREFIDKKYGVSNDSVYAKYPDAVVGYRTYTLKNSYHNDIGMRVAVQIRHLTPLLQMAQRFTCWVPVSHLQCEHAEKFNMLLASSQRGRFFTYFVDRVCWLAVIVFVTMYNDPVGTVNTTALAITAGIMAISFIPSAIASGTIAWQKVIEDEYERMTSSQEKSEVGSELQDKYNYMRQLREKETRSTFSMFHCSNIKRLWTTFVNADFQKTRAMAVLKKVVFGPVMTESLKFFILVALQICNGKVGSLAGNGGICLIAELGVLLALVFINVHSIGRAINTWTSFVFRLYHWAKIGAYELFDVATNLSHYATIAAFYAKTSCMWVVSKVTNGTVCKPPATFRYPNSRSPFNPTKTIKVNAVELVVPELGLSMPGHLRLSESPTKQLYNKRLARPQRYELYKSVYCYGPVGGMRDMNAKMPVVMNYRQLVRDDPQHQMSRLVATLQVANHTGQRYPVECGVFGEEDDSYLSLYTDPKFVKERGSVKLTPGNFAHTVRYDSSSHRVLIRGPSIKADYLYTVQSEPAALSESYGDVSPSGTPINANKPGYVGGEVVAETFCETAGRLEMALPDGMVPDLYMSMMIEGEIGGTVVINPNDIKIEFQPLGWEMLLRHRELQRGVKYTVTWTNLTRGPAVTGEGRADSNGTLAIQLKETGGGGRVAPDLSTQMLIVTDQQNQSFQIDPKDTDAYLCVISGAQRTGINWILQRIKQLGIRLVAQALGKDLPIELEEWIPCTVLACLDPDVSLYRVEPNFKEHLKELEAQSHELEAQLMDLRGNDDATEALAVETLGERDFIKWWRDNGVDIVYDTRWINPLVERNHPSLMRYAKHLPQLEKKLRLRLDEVLKEKLAHLHQKILRYRVWDTGYGDAELYDAQQTLDAALWSQVSEDEVAELKKLVQEKTKQYSAHLANFAYPADIEGSCIMPKPLLSHQIRQWESAVAVWLQEEVGASETAQCGGGSRLSCTAKHMMKVVHNTFLQAENISSGQYKPVLHFLMNSLTACGKSASWKPDSMAAQPSFVRCWEFDAKTGEIDPTKPAWVSCMVKLTATCLKIMMPEAGDVDRTFGTSKPWKQVKGWTIPLKTFDNLDMWEVDHYAEDETHVDLQANKLCLEFQRGQQENDEIPAVFRIEDGVGDTTVKWCGQEFKLEPGDTIDGQLICPLRIRTASQFRKKWCQAARGAQMNQPPQSVDGYTGRVVLHPQYVRAAEVDSSPIAQKAQSPLRAQRVPSPRAVADAMSPPLVLNVERHTSREGSVASAASKPASLRSRASGVSITSPPVYLRNDKNAEQKYYDYTESPPKYLGRYFGDWNNHKYHGKGKLYDADGTCVYEGSWANGVRWGQGVCFFQDRNGLLWRYDGEFVDDEMCGTGVLTLVDKKEVQRLSSGAAESKFEIVQYMGLFNSNRVDPQMGAPAEATLPEINEDVFRALFYGVGPPGTEQSASSQLVTSRMGELQASWTPATLDEYLPNMHKWTRLVDPAEGNQDLFQRFDPSGVTNMADGAKYTGPIKDGKPHTQQGGRYEYQTFVYEGGFEEGLPHGSGWIRGYSKEGAMSGSSYEGQWVNGFRHGRGELQAMGGKVTLSGEFESDLPSGVESTITVSDAVAGREIPFKLYRGGMAKGNLNATDAYLEFPENIVYTGGITEGQRSGNGLLKKGDTTIYDGQWLTDLPHGRASRMDLGEGMVYSGDIIQGKRQGHGELFKENGTKIWYEGLWLNDVPAGRGSAFSDDGQYEGEYKEGKRHGKGRFVYSEETLDDGRNRVYEGDWADDLPHGVAKYLDEQGMEATYKFQKGEMDMDSRKQYKAMCGSLPNNISRQRVTPTGIQPYKQQYWGTGLSLQTDTLQKVRVGCEGIWRNYQTSKFSFVAPDVEAKPSLSTKASVRSTDRLTSLNSSKAPMAGA